MNKCVVIITLFFITSVSWAENIPDVIGEVYTFDGKQELYREMHYYSEDGYNHQVLYHSLDGKQFAKKDLNYKSGQFTPAFRQEDTRYPETIDVKWVGEQLSISYFAKDDGPKREKLFDVEAPLVIDAGFDRFIRENWASLIEGDKLKFNFPAPARMILASLVVENKACSYSTEADMCFLVNASNWIVKLLVDPIELGYDKKSQKLKRFRGVGNIHNEDGKSIKVDIRYRYSKACDSSSELISCMDKANRLDSQQSSLLPAATSIIQANSTTRLDDNAVSPHRYQW